LYLQLGRTGEGVSVLRKALTLSPNDPVIIGKLVEGLCLADRAHEARDVLRAARFRNPRDARFRKVWNDFQFQQLVDAPAESACARGPCNPAVGSPRGAERLAETSGADPAARSWLETGPPPASSRLA